MNPPQSWIFSSTFLPSTSNVAFLSPSAEAANTYARLYGPDGRSIICPLATAALGAPVLAGASWNCTSLNLIRFGSISAGSAFPSLSNPPTERVPSLLAVARSYFNGTGSDCTTGTLVDPFASFTAKVRG